MKDQNAGFTIIELMIATAVLSTILVMVTGMMIGIGNLYYKGVNQSRVQAAVRGLDDEITQSLQLSDKSPDHQHNVINITSPQTGASYQAFAWCIGNTRYSYVLGAQLNKTFPHVLWRDDAPSGGCDQSVGLNIDPPSNTTNHGTELMPANARLTDFNITNANGAYQVVIGIAYGDDDLLCNNKAGNDCATDDVSLAHLTGVKNGRSDDIQCRGHIGDQFCATANAKSVVVKRLSGG